MACPRVIPALPAPHLVPWSVPSIHRPALELLSVTTPDAHAQFAAIMAGRPVLLAPMEDVSDPPFRRLCRELGADLCYTEFVNVDGLVRGDRRALRKITLDQDDRPLGIQIYG